MLFGTEADAAQCKKLHRRSYLADWLRGVTDMRKGFNDLSIVVQDALEQDPFSGHQQRHRRDVAEFNLVAWITVGRPAQLYSRWALVVAAFSFS